MARFYRDLHGSNHLFRLVSPFGWWIRSPHYVLMLRLIGALMVAMALLILFVMIRGLIT